MPKRQNKLDVVELLTAYLLIQAGMSMGNAIVTALAVRDDPDVQRHALAVFTLRRLERLERDAEAFYESTGYRPNTDA